MFNKSNISITNDNNLDFRFKRINIIFKIIYVVAGFLGAFFVSLGETLNYKISSTYILYSFVSAFLLTNLLNMLNYVFNEIKCMIISPNAFSQDEINKIEISYIFIFKGLLSSGISVVFGVVGGSLFLDNINYNVISNILLWLIVLLLAFIYIILPFCNASTENKLYLFIKKCICVLITFITCCFLLLPALPNS